MAEPNSSESLSTIYVTSYMEKTMRALTLLDQMCFHLYNGGDVWLRIKPETLLAVRVMRKAKRELADEIAYLLTAQHLGGEWDDERPSND